MNQGVYKKLATKIILVLTRGPTMLVRNQHIAVAPLYLMDHFPNCWGLHTDLTT